MKMSALLSESSHEATVKAPSSVARLVVLARVLMQRFRAAFYSSLPFGLVFVMAELVFTIRYARG